ncbi:proline imino-peptidase [Minicystis rosea]|nr:proline imino-peptidase [Minicystis rosea]
MLVPALTAVLPLSAAGALAHRAWRRRRAARALVIDAPDGIDEQRFVLIGGVEQWIDIRGDDRGNPVLLEIHGGPGASNTIFATRTRSWEAHFTVVRWDMRGAGRTFGRGGAAGQGELSLARLLADAVEVAEHVRARLGKEKLVLLANSFGSILGLRLARTRPDLFAAYVGTDQNLGHPGGDDPDHDAAVAQLRAEGRRRDAAAMERMGRDPVRWSARDWATRSRLRAQGDPRLRAVMRDVVMPSLWFSPRHGLRDLRDFAAGMSFSERLYPEVLDVDPRREGTRFEIPFFVFQGEHDVLTPAALAAQYVADVHAPAKEFARIVDATHFASFCEPAQFLDLLLTRVRPHLAP